MKTGEAGFDGGFHGISMMQQHLLRERDDQNAIRCRRTHAHNRTHQGGNAERCVGDEQEANDSGECNAEGHDNDEWIEHD